MTLSDGTVIAAHFPQKWGGQPTLKTLFFIKTKMVLIDSIDGKFQATLGKIIRDFVIMVAYGNLFGDVYPKLKNNISGLGFSVFNMWSK